MTAVIGADHSLVSTNPIIARDGRQLCTMLNSKRLVEIPDCGGHWVVARHQ